MAGIGTPVAGGDAAITSFAVRRFVVRLVAGILVGTFAPLGAIFLVIGLGADGDVAGFVPVGIGALVVAGLCLVALLAAGPLFGARLERERAARVARATATVEHVELKPYNRVGSLVTAVLTVRFAPAGGGGARAVSRRLYVSPLLRVVIGGELTIAYDPAEPENFVPLLT